MDPLSTAAPDEQGYVHLNERLRLHYELYRSSASSSNSSSRQQPQAAAGTNTRPAPLLMVMGAFATKVHFMGMARYLADQSGHEVCIYDHRGVGRSSEPVLEAQTAAQLAADALVLADNLWGPRAPIHVFGASMGGMVAQELALLLIPQHRLLSLSLYITCRGLKPLNGLLSPIFTPKILKAFFELWFWDSKPKLVRRLMRLLLMRSLLDSLHPCGDTYGQVYYRAWLERFDELWTLNNHAAGACHAHVVLHQHLSDAQLAAIRDSGVPLVCQVSTHDNLIPAAMQFELADKLRARVVTIPTGHMGFLPWKGRFHGAVLEQLAMGEAVRGVQQAQRARASRAGETAGEAAAAAAGGGAGGVSAVGSASLLVSLAKPLFTALSGGSSCRAGVDRQHLASSAAANSSQQQGVCCPGDDDGDAAAAADMAIVLDDDSGVSGHGCDAAAS